MYLVIAFISRVQKINDLILKMQERGFTGGTLIDSVGMKHAAPIAMDIPLIASLHSIFIEEGEISKTLFCLVENPVQVNQLMDLIEESVGNLDSPNTGLAFSFKVDQVRGYKRQDIS
jgi:hypothetical protein